MNARATRLGLTGGVLLALLLSLAVVFAPSARADGSWTYNSGNGTVSITWAPDNPANHAIYVYFVLPYNVISASCGNGHAAQLAAPEGVPNEFECNNVPPGVVTAKLASAMTCTDTIRHYDSFDGTGYSRQKDIPAAVNCGNPTSSPSASPTATATSTAKPCAPSGLLSDLADLLESVKHARDKADDKNFDDAKFKDLVRIVEKEKRHLIEENFDNVKIAGINGSKFILWYDELILSLNKARHSAIDGEGHKKEYLNHLDDALKTAEKLAAAAKASGDKALSAGMDKLIRHIEAVIDRHKSVDSFQEEAALRDVRKLQVEFQVLISANVAGKTFGIPTVSGIVERLYGIDRGLEDAAWTRIGAGVRGTEDAVHELEQLIKALKAATCA